MDVKVDVRPVADMVDGLEQLTVAMAAAERTREKLYNEVTARTGELKRALESGLTTGDPVTDLVVLAGYSLDPELLEICHELDAALKGKLHQLVLVVFSATVSKHLIRSDRHERRHATMCRLGLLEAEALVLARGPHSGYLSLPVSFYIETEKTWCPDDCKLSPPRVEEGNILSRHRLRPPPPHLGEVLCPRGVTREEEPWTGRVAVGNEAVEAWLAQNKMPGFYAPVLAVLQAAGKQTAA